MPHAMTLEELTSLKELLIQHDLWAKKSLGQNFLLNPEITDRIAKSAQVQHKLVVEVGPGPGGLTRSLLKMGCKHLIAVEKDRRFITLLAPLTLLKGMSFDLLEADALKIKIEDLRSQFAKNQEKITIVANLPYNIGTRLLIQFLREISHIESMTLMFQKEVAQRMVAKPGTSEYGRLSLLSQFMCEVKLLFDLAPGAFTPPPKVTSSVVQFIPKALSQEEKNLLPFLEKITEKAFGQRRKMLKTSLKSLLSEEEIRQCSIDPSLRAETLSLSDFSALAKILIRKGDA